VANKLGLKFSVTCFSYEFTQQSSKYSSPCFVNFEIYRSTGLHCAVVVHKTYICVVFTQTPTFIFGHVPPKKSKYVGHAHLKNFSFGLCKNI
jgi:hypothetical protein